MSVQVSPRIDYFQPLSSPYEAPVVTATIGNKKYSIPGSCLRKCPQFEQQSFLYSYITLSDVHEDVGHTFVHFLYSGCYEMIDSSVEDGTSSLVREYKRSVLIYQASRTYQLPALEAFARDYIERFGEELSMTDILRITREVISKLPDDETWLPKYIERNLRQSLRSTKSEFDLDELYNVLGQGHYFDNTVTKMMLEILLHSQEITSLDARSPCEQTHSYGNGEGNAPIDESLDKVTNGRQYTEESSDGNPASVEAVTDEPNAADYLVAAEDSPDQLRPTKVSLEDVALYQNWKSMSSKKSAKRTRTLVARGLPIPGKNGIVSIFAGGVKFSDFLL